MTLTLDGLVQQYIQECASVRSLETQIRFYNKLDLAEAITHVCNKGAYKVGDQTYKNRHFDRRKKASLDALKDSLLNRIPDLHAANSFEEIYRIIQEEGRRIKDIGVLTVYDVAVRIGVSKKIIPGKLYLQAGAATGAYKLGLITNMKHLVIDVEIAYAKHPALRDLNACQIENFFCIYKDDFLNESDRHLFKHIPADIKKNGAIRKKEYNRYC